MTNSPVRTWTLLGFACAATALLTGCQPSFYSFTANRPAIQELAIGPIDVSSINLRSAVDLDEDRTLSPWELRWLVTNRTMGLAQFSSPENSQPVFFSRSGDMTMQPEAGRTVEGSWWLEDNQVCYGVDQGSVCSVLNETVFAATPFLYFARTDERGLAQHPTAVIVSRQNGRQFEPSTLH